MYSFLFAGKKTNKKHLDEKREHTNSLRGQGTLEQQCLKKIFQGQKH